MTPLLLKDWPVDSGKRNAYVDAVFRRVAPRYDRLTRLLSFGRDESWKESAVGLLPADDPDARILDLATGTGAFPVLLRRRGHRGAIVGLDRSRDMIARARMKCAEMERVDFALGDLNALPLAAESFDAIVMGYGLRYLDSLGGGAAAAFRALRPGGVLVTLDFGLPTRRWYRSLCLAYLLSFGTLWGLVLHGRLDTYWHIVESLRAYPGQAALAEALEGAGFVSIAIAEELGGISTIARAEKPGRRTAPDARPAEAAETLGIYSSR